MTKEMKRPISNITQDSIKPLLSNAVEFYTNKNREAHKCIQERDEYINYLESKLSNAKPQLFYLRDELTGQFLAKDNQFKNEDRYFFWTGADPLTHSIGTAWKLTFTQQEIDSMQTGSYELVPVEDGE